VMSRWCPVLIALWSIGCSSGGRNEAATAPVNEADAGAGESGAEAAVDGSGCEVATCASSGADCGQMPDGCGGVVDCGTCAAGEYCGANGPNRCGSTPCTPITCASAGFDCGTVSDGCSKILSCGTCEGSESCGGGGKPNKCGCEPSSNCYAAECGVVADGCGGTVDCGSCGTGWVCMNNGCCVGAVGASCTKTCEMLKEPVKGYSQFEDVWCNAEGQSKASVVNCTGPDSDPCTTYGAPPGCGLLPGYSWCDVTCRYIYDCPGKTFCDGSCL